MKLESESIVIKTLFIYFHSLSLSRPSFVLFSARFYLTIIS